MLQRGVAPVEMTYTALSRVAARGNDGAKAYEWVQKMRAAGITPKLRSFVPALNAYCASGDVQGARHAAAYCPAARSPAAAVRAACPARRWLSSSRPPGRRPRRRTRF